jgi:hypothetical protein
VLDDLETAGAQVAKLLAGTLLNEITDHMLAAVNSSIPVDEKPRKMYMYSSVSRFIVKSPLDSMFMK